MTNREESADARAGRKHLEKAGLAGGKCLGTGFDGAVFVDPDDRGRVLKVTRSFNEAMTTEWLCTSPHEHVFFPRVYKVVRLSSRWQKQDAFVVSREEVPTLVLRDPEEFYSQVDRIGYDAESGLTPSINSAILSTARPEHVALLEQFVDLFLDSKRVGFSLGGLHDSNIGLRRGRIVVRDMGVCRPPAQFRSTLMRRKSRGEPAVREVTRPVRFEETLSEPVR